ncbi:MAG: type II toxin-antitoxin system HicA family toxin [Chloroflexota bacterium]|nr:type II toxin-antitoxin system HicA family toxin [Chloroflexota bacterium]
MSKLRPAKPDEVQRVLGRLGFQLIRQSGSHAVYRHPDGRWTTVPIHPGKDVAKGTMRKIIKDVGITVDAFESMR